MRNLLIVIVVLVVGYFAWTYYQGHKERFARAIPLLSASSDETQAPDEPIPPFVSRVKIPDPPPDAPPGAKPVAPPGSVYVLDRASVQTANGVIAIVPGDLVKLLQRKDNGKVRVTNDLADFELKEEQVTSDPEIAQIAERRDYEKRYHIH